MKKNFAEFFAGVGLVHEGLRRDQWQCLWANDISADKQATYTANYGGGAFHLDDLWNCVTAPELIPEPCFLYTASFPCTDLSLAGDRRGLAGAESGSLHAFLQILAHKNTQGLAPPMVMLENVQGFLTSHQGADIAATVKSLNQLGYRVDLIELDAAHFTPQSRPRVFLFALRQEYAASIMHAKNDGDDGRWWQMFDMNPQLRTARIRKVIRANPDLDWGMFDIPPPPVRSSTLADIIDTTLPADSAFWWDETRKNHLYHQMFERHQAQLAAMQQADVYAYGTVFRRMRENQSRAELRTDGIAGCLRTPRGGSSKQILIRAGFGKWDVRLLTPREYARLQGVRDSFVLPENQNQGYFAMADAVCVPAIEFISRHVLTPSHEKSARTCQQIPA
jgi:DNA (cytosine-5)-methyltransferase 1